VKKIIHTLKPRSQIIAVVFGFLAIMLCLHTPVQADPFFFSTGDPDGKMATASRPASAGKIEIEAADDFVLLKATTITKASFTGLVPSGASVQQVVVEIYRVFPKDSDVGRTSGAPTFSTSLVPTRVNSPSDVAVDGRDSGAGNLSFSTSTLSATFTTLNSVQPIGINPKPNQTTGGNGPVTGAEVEFGVTFASPVVLPADHYFFVPQVQLDSGDFFWLSAPRPIVPPGTPFPAGNTDLQSWIRNETLAPDWLRVGTDIVGGATPPTFNAAFSLAGEFVPVPSTLLLVSSGLGLLAWRRFRQGIAITKKFFNL
jgi:hypothetical protein